MLVHVTEWSFYNQRSVCYSSLGAEIILSSDEDDRIYDLRESIRFIFSSTGDMPIQSRLFTDFSGLWDTKSHLHESLDYRMSQTFQRIRESVESVELNSIFWITGTENIAEALTKRSIPLPQKLNKICTESALDYFSQS